MSGGVNDSSTPVDMPVNEWTQMIEAVRERNLRGAPMPPEPVGVPNVGTPMPAVRSADFGRPVADDPNRALSTEEIEELNRLAIESGMVQGPVNPSIARTMEAGDDGSQYGSLEEAIAAGAPVGADDQEVAEGARRFRDVAPSSPTIHVRTPVVARLTAREYVAANPLARLPDFKKVQMIDMVNGQIYVDGLSFTIQPAELKMLRKFCVTTAKDQIQAALDAALKELAEDEDGRTATV